MHEVILDDLINVASKLQDLPEKSYYKIIITKPAFSFSVVVEKVYCKVFGSVGMYLDNDVKVHILNIDIIWDSVCIPLSLLNYYIDMLQKVNSKYEVFYIYLLMKYQMKAGDAVIIEQGSKIKKGIILDPECSPSGQLMYKLIKKNGELGIKSFILYGKSSSYNHYCEDREFIDYSKIL